MGAGRDLCERERNLCVVTHTGTKKWPAYDINLKYFVYVNKWYFICMFLYCLNENVIRTKMILAALSFAA